MSSRILFILSAVIFSATILMMSSMTSAGRRPVQVTVTSENYAENTEYDALVKEALGSLRKAWKDMAREDKYMNTPHVNVRDTRIIKISENPVRKDTAEEKEVEELRDVEYIIEFLLYSNYISDTYPLNVGICDSVTVYKNGEMEAPKKNLLTLVRAKYYISDFSGIIDEIIYLGDAYDGELFN